jgi:single-stranded-DNA-specific exonuclease
MKSYSVRERAVEELPAPDSGLLGELLFNRGLKTAEQARYFLNPDYDAHGHNPFLLKDMDKAVERILRAIRSNNGSVEKTIIYSDYDTDGIPGAVVLHDFFKKAGFTNFTNYIPHRHDEGFGLNSDAVKQFIADGVKLLITIDCGIADTAHVKEAQDAGIDVIITDHHMPPLEASEIPPAYAIINPKQVGCAYPEKMLCGSGVVFKLIQGILAKDRLGIKEGHEKWFLDMVGVATLSDMVPLTGENRMLAYYGLMVLRKSPRLGIMRLLRELSVDQRYITEDDIGFTIGPRINAASRMGVPMDAFNLLATNDPVEADQYAKHLNAINDERKGTVAALVKEAKKIISERWGDDAMPKVIVMGNPQWRPALVGLAANTLAEKYSCPTFIWGRDGDGVIKGSCRSEGETDLVGLMRIAESASPGTFIQFGGHAFSGGFSISNEKIHDLPKKINDAFDTLKKMPKAVPAILVDKEMSLGDVTWGTYRTIEKLAPFGMANPKPLFMFKNVTPSVVRQFGKDKNHLEVMLGGVKAIGFFMTSADWTDSLGGDIAVGKPITLIAHFEKSVFRGKTELRLRIVDVLS